MPYIIMDYNGVPVSPSDLNTVAQQCAGAFPPRDYTRTVLMELKKYALEIKRIHESGYLLLDIKPGNVLISEHHGMLFYRRIIDYGSCTSVHKFLDGNDHDVLSVSFTMGFAAPEVGMGRFSDIGPWSDVFSFGLTVMAFLAGRSFMSKSLVPPERLSSEAGLEVGTFREALISGGALENLLYKDDAFFLKLRNFCNHTLSREVMEENLDDDAALMLIQQTRKSGSQKQVRSMRNVIRMLDALIGNSLYPELDESAVRERIRTSVGVFRYHTYELPIPGRTRAQ